jgi:hypothetical protein
MELKTLQHTETINNDGQMYIHTYKDNKIIQSDPVEIEDHVKFTALLEEVKQYNKEHASDGYMKILGK